MSSHDGAFVKFYFIILKSKEEWLNYYCFYPLTEFFGCDIIAMDGDFSDFD